MSTAIQPSKWPALCARRYGAIANARPPRKAAARGSRSWRSQPYVTRPAATIPASSSTFQATTGPNAASSGQKGIPNGQPLRFSCCSVSGWKLYGSRHGAAPCPSWWPSSQKRYAACR